MPSIDKILKASAKMDTSNDQGSKRKRDYSDVSSEEEGPKEQKPKGDASSDKEGEKPKAKGSRRRVSMSPGTKKTPTAWETVMGKGKKVGKAIKKKPVREPDWQRKL